MDPNSPHNGTIGPAGGHKTVRRPYLPQRPLPPQPASPPLPKVRTNILLFAATVLTTMMAGALHKGVDPFASIWNLLQGLPFSAALLSILLAHEMGHYLTSRAHKVQASLPYFIPMPTFIGTMGAIIRMRTVVRDRRVLFDIGIAGPLAGMVVAIPVTIIGLLYSQVIDISSPTAGITLGDSLLFSAFTRLIFGSLPETKTVLLHPVAFAGWLGFFVTSLNLIPIGQLDGGHVAYGMLGPRHRTLSRGFFFCLLLWGLHSVYSDLFNPWEWLWAAAFCWTGYKVARSHQQGSILRFFALFLLITGIANNYVPDTIMWLFWATLLCFLRLDHPPTRDVSIPLDQKRTVLGWIALLIFVLTFIPKPFQQIIP